MVNEGELVQYSEPLNGNENRDDLCMEATADIGCNTITTDSIVGWFKSHLIGKIFASILQIMVLADVNSDLVVLLKLLDYGDTWWFYVALSVLYLSLRIAVISTLEIENSVFRQERTEGRFNLTVNRAWDILLATGGFYRKEHWAQASLRDYILLYIPGAWHFVSIVRDIRNKADYSICDIIIDFMYILFVEFILAPIYAVFISPIVLVTHAIRGIYIVWNTNSVTFVRNPFEIQTIIFYNTIALFFETIAEAVPQFLLQSWVYWHNRDIIPAMIYYISVSISLLNIVRSTIIFIQRRRELDFTSHRLVQNVTTEDHICMWDESTKKLNLKWTDVDTIILMIKKYPNVQDLDISWSGFTDDGVKKVVKYLRHLKILNICWTKISDMGIKILTENCSTINSLDLLGTDITDEGVMSIAARGSQIISLNLGLKNMNDEGLKALSKGCPRLKSLNLSNTQITDEGLTAIATSCLQLTSINLYATKVTDKSVSCLLSSCKQLGKVHLPWTTFHEDAVENYRRKFPNIDIQCCF